MDIGYVNYLKSQKTRLYKVLKTISFSLHNISIQFASVFYTYRGSIFLQSYEVYTIIFNIEYFDDYGGGCGFFNADVYHLM